MNDTVGLTKLGRELREMRSRRGLTQAQLSALARVPRRKIIEIEQGSGSVAAQSYADVAAALGAQLTMRAYQRPTLDELGELFKS